MEGLQVKTYFVGHMILVFEDEDKHEWMADDLVLLNDKKPPSWLGCTIAELEGERDIGWLPDTVVVFEDEKKFDCLPVAMVLINRLDYLMLLQFEKTETHLTDFLMTLL